MRVLFSALSLALSLSLTQSAQLSLSDFTCADGYPVQVLSFLFECAGSSCTFGDTANFTGWFEYSNLTSESAEIKAEITKSGYSYQLFNDTIDLCYNNTSINGGYCPADNGEYIVEFDHIIPSTGVYDWFFTGISLKTHITLSNTDGNETEILGDCYATLTTQTTSQTTVASTTYKTPSAAMTFILVGASLVTFLLVKGATGGSPVDSQDDKRSSLMNDVPIVPIRVPDEIERARSTFAEELSWPKANREDGEPRGTMA